MFRTGLQGAGQSLQDLVRRELSPHEYPRVVEFVDELPKTANGKINRKALRDAVAAPKLTTWTSGGRAKDAAITQPDPRR